METDIKPEEKQGIKGALIAAIAAIICTLLTIMCNSEKASVIQNNKSGPNQNANHDINNNYYSDSGISRHDTVFIKDIIKKKSRPNKTVNDNRKTINIKTLNGNLIVK
jgi:hypothetical protein